MFPVTDQLFDPDLYRSPSDTDRKPRQAKQQPDMAVEPWLEPWVLISTRKGVLPFHHLPVDPTKLAAAVKAGIISGATLTECGVFGNPIGKDAWTTNQMIRCPDCKEKP